MRLYVVAILFFLCLPLHSVWAQQPSRADLERRRTNLLNEISATQQQLEATKQDKKATLGQLRALTAQLGARQRLINNINSELANISGNIDQSTAEITQMNADLKTLQKNYAQSIRYAYKHRVSQNMMVFVFSASDFNDAIRRLRYLRKYRDYRKNQAEKIRKTQALLEQKVNVLNAQKKQKGQLLATEEVQKNELQQETQQTNQVMSELRGREKELVAQIQQNQRNARKLEASIKEQIRREIEIARQKALEEARRKAAEEALARKRAAEEDARRKAAAAQAAADAKARDVAAVKARAAQQSQPKTDNEHTYTANNQSVKLNTGAINNKVSVPEEKPQEKVASVATTNKAPVAAVEKTSYKLSLTPDVQALSANFAANRGRLPWPVEQGFVSVPYGKHPNKLFPSVTEENNGVDIATGAGAAVRSVFDGTVIKIANIDGVMVMVSHGEYFTIYTKLSGASVSVGQKVNARQAIGRAGRNDEGENVVNFQIWKVNPNGSFFTVNPAEWIAR
ncbi:MAG: peptidoglycan DD-metalloendopeptidase family protein [Edaphocola sp.]